MVYQVKYRKEFKPAFTTPASLNKEEYVHITCVDAPDLEALFRMMNVVDGTELPISLRCRSMSVGDVAVDESGAAHYCAACGWEETQFA